VGLFRTPHISRMKADADARFIAPEDEGGEALAAAAEALIAEQQQVRQTRSQPERYVVWMTREVGKVTENSTSWQWVVYRTFER
jgi:hypothetical protein